ncbi:cytochrome protein [Zopfia rhizophila CBS 207.26]|uniref:Cytochrome protein n=1 Tax=Zopfia rhizophila CBS 207.26 TaxID=1314779 RepID=A0A6A6DY40_9PEZI|nr:cytochrome protein [Zopfia rhizophila CBS 207.26]
MSPPQNTNGIRNTLSHIPGPRISKWTGLVLKYYSITGRRALYVHKLHQEYGPVVRICPDEVDFASTTAAKQIHAVSGGFMKAALYTHITSSKVPNVFSTLDPVYHSVHRRLLSGPMSESSLKLVEPVVRARSSLAIERIGGEMKKRGCADVLKWWVFMATDIIGELSFGDSFRMLEQGNKNQYAHDLDKVAFAGGLRANFPTLINLAAYLPIPLFRDAAASGQRMQVYARESIQRYRNLIAAEPSNPKPTLFTKLFKAGEEGMSPDEIRAEAQGYIIAGSDTTANTLTYLIWAVCRDEAIKRRLVEELVSLPDDFRDRDLKNLSYLHQVIQETLRLYASAPSALPREVPRGGAELDGYWIPGGFTVSTQAYSMHRDPEIYPQPESFDPSRWETPTKAMKDAWMPFGGGSRTCLGLHLANMELRNAVARFFRAFPNAKVSNLEGMSDADMEKVIFFLMVPKGKRCLIQAS